MPDNASKEVTTAPARRSGPLQFIQEVRRETSKVTWPSWRETATSTTMFVFITVTVAMIFFALVDYILGFGLNLLLRVLIGQYRRKFHVGALVHRSHLFELREEGRR